jgi:hypothetical protein
MYDNDSTNMLNVNVSNPITPRNGKNIDNSTEDNDVRPSNFDVDEVYFDSNNVQQRPLSKNDLHSQYTKNISNSKSKVYEGHNSSVISRGIFTDRYKASQGDNQSRCRCQATPAHSRAERPLSPRNPCGASRAVPTAALFHARGRTRCWHPVCFYGGLPQPDPHGGGTGDG